MSIITPSTSSSDSTSGKTNVNIIVISTLSFKVALYMLDESEEWNLLSSLRICTTINYLRKLSYAYLRKIKSYRRRPHKITITWRNHDKMKTETRSYRSL